MKRILDWLKEKKPRSTVSAEPDQTTDDNDDKEYTIRESVMPDIYREDHETSEPVLKIPDSTSPDINESPGFDPYDTVVLHEKHGVKKS